MRLANEEFMLMEDKVKSVKEKKDKVNQNVEDYKRQIVKHKETLGVPKKDFDLVKGKIEKTK